MNYLKLKYLKYFIFCITIYLLFTILIRLLNFYTLLLLVFLIYILYILDKKLFKRIVYKIFYTNKKYPHSIKNTYGAAKTSLDSIDKINRKISDKVNFELLNYEKNKLESQLKTGDYKVTLFGAGSSGKTSIARSLLKNIIGQTSAKIGTTKQINSYKIRIPILKRNISIIDTPGLFEPSNLGEQREKLTILEASNSDLILFVLDQDINKYENYLIEELLKIGKKIIIVLNKCDLRSRDDNNLIKKNIISITSARKNNISVVQTIAIPQSSHHQKSDTIFIGPDVGSLFREIVETLYASGEELLADNILFRSNKLGIKSKNFIQEQRYLISNKIINKYMWITGGVILVNPLPALDFLTTTSVNVQMILELSKIYEIKLTKNNAKDLSKSLISTLAKLGILKGGLAIISPVLATSFTKIIISKSIQSITAAWLFRIVGLSLIEYFKNGQNWGDGGIQEVVDKIYKLSTREEFLTNFVKEAISKIEITKILKSENRLPPSSM
ncbi:MAG: GTP-binding protein [Prochlorococcus marinus CUG1438]|nr:GTP-binding protein [Prochlorococcus marinus CUG1438]